jgi:hypothetical protein
MDSLAADAKGTGVRVNSILPSIIDTEVNRLAMPGSDFAAWPKPQDIARVVLFLSSDLAVPEAEAENYHINPFDLTRVWPHADYPLIEVGEMTLDRNPVIYSVALRWIRSTSSVPARLQAQRWDVTTTATTATSTRSRATSSA